MKDPRKQSLTATPQTPQAILMPDQGTTPISRMIDRRIHGAVFDWAVEVELESPCSTFLVASNARGNQWDSKGAIGLANNEAITEPMVVSKVRRRVAHAG